MCGPEIRRVPQCLFCPVIAVVSKRWPDMALELNRREQPLAGMDVPPLSKSLALQCKSFAFYVWQQFCRLKT